MTVSIIGLDIAKNTFHVVGQTQHGREVMKKQLRRAQVVGYFAQVEPCIVGLETCAGANHWGRELEKLGHEVRLVSAKVVKRYVGGAKNDYNDARAICEALSRANVRTMRPKSIEQQDVQALSRLREAAKDARTALVNRLRGLLGEYGVVLPQGIGSARRRLPDVLEDAENGLSDAFRELLAHEYEELTRLDERVREFDRRLVQVQRERDDTRRLSEIPGVGPVLSTALVGHFGDARQFANGRGLSACLGVVPHQHSTGGKPLLLGISKRGNRQLRSLFIHGARSVLRHAAGKDDRLRRWALQVQARRGTNVAAVALANKLARIAWVVLARGERFDPARV